MKTRVSILEVLLIILVFCSLSCAVIDQKNTCKGKTVFDFESDPAEICTINSQYASITDNPAEVISGKRSLKMDTRTGSQEQNDLWVTLPKGVTLEGGKRYKISFNYKVVDVNLADSYFYFVAKSQSAKAPDQGETQFRENRGDPGFHEKNIIIPKDVNDYRLHFGVGKKGVIILDNICISSLPDLDLNAKGVAVETKNYEPYGICTHFSWVTDQPVADHPDWSTNNTSGYTDQQVIKGIQMLKASGIQWFRVDAAWADTEPQEGKYSMAKLNRLDLIIDQAEKNGMKVYLILFSTPQWASEKPEDKDFWAYAPKDISKWSHYVKYIAQRYKGRITYWEIGNEIDWEFWRSDLPKFAEYLKVAYKALKQVDPDNKVIMSGLAFDGTYVWRVLMPGADEYVLQKLYDAGVKDYFDIFAIHPYAHCMEDHIIKSLDSVNNSCKIMKANGDSNKPIWITELGAASSTLGSPEKQAVYLEKVYTQLIKHPKIEKIFWYNFRNKVTGGELEDGLGIINHDMTTKPAYEMLKSLPKTKVRMVNPRMLEE
jgi:hypothetical protein